MDEPSLESKITSRAHEEGHIGTESRRGLLGDARAVIGHQPVRQVCTSQRARGARSAPTLGTLRSSSSR